MRTRGRQLSLRGRKRAGIGSSSSGGFSPLLLSPAAWYDASDASTRYQDSALTTLATADSDPVGGWKDKSGHNRHATQATAAARPTLKLAIQNGLPGVLGDGADDYLSADALGAVFSGSDVPFAVVVVASAPAAAGSGQLCAFGSTASATPLHMCRPRDAGNVIAGYRRATAGGDVYVTGGAVGSSATRLFEWIFTGTALTFAVNGAESASQAMDVGACNWDTFTLFAMRRALQLSGAEFLNNYMHELIVLPATPTEGQRSSYRDYLNEKWAVY